MPRSLAYCGMRVNECLDGINQQHGEAREQQAQLRQAMRVRLDQPIEQIFDNGLHEFLRDFLSAKAAMVRKIERDYPFVESIMRLSIEHCTQYEIHASTALVCNNCG